MQVHYLSGPIAVDTAEKGDLLKVEILNLGTLAGDEWGFTGTFHKDNGGGFLTDHYPQVTTRIRIARVPRGDRVVSPLFRRRRRAGIWRGCTPSRGTSPACASPASSTRA